eukprot:Gregarina_sp_Poly_1__1421@NODE_1354_length_4307_cov_66_336085_g908_i0_p3_GENE_NODE_1354_length_4307_cov_66_336085_g908_i0NODE_1354_length_4307_cov_66_336085_g908_i0_p3_ORF_typecomplete_len254_score31_05Peptidase_M24_C/PF16188_5/0_59Peptidase_M24_C/PF16188_5/2_6e03Peptidase_M24_C/PF16188_5/2e02_NODE_1354_length_4307_cov_66_336085_g908_i05931354
MSQVPEESEIGVDNLISESDPIKKKFFFLSTISDEETEWLDKKYVSSVMDALCQIDKDMGAKWEDVVLNPEISTAKFLENRNMRAHIENINLMQEGIQNIKKTKELMATKPFTPEENQDVRRFARKAKKSFLSLLVNGINSIPVCLMLKKNFAKQKAQEWLAKINDGVSIAQIMADLDNLEEKAIFILATPVPPKVTGSGNYLGYVTQALEKIVPRDETFDSWVQYHRRIYTRLQSASLKHWFNLDLGRVFHF